MEDNTVQEKNNEVDSEDKQDSSQLNQNEISDEEESADRLERKLKDAYGKQDDLQNKYLRVHADLENIKKRAIKEREDAVQRTRSQIIGDLLPIIDSFKMGLTEASKHESSKTYVEGFSMAMSLMQSTLNEYGLHVIESTSKPFDPKIVNSILILGCNIYLNIFSLINISRISKRIIIFIKMFRHSICIP